MKGGIYSDQRCPVCGGLFRDSGRDVSCPVHPEARASRFTVRFGGITKRFRSYGAAGKFLTGVRFKTDERTYDERDYKRDNPLSFSVVTDRWRKVKEGSVRRHSFRSICNHLLRAQSWFGSRSVKDIGFSDLEDFINAQTDVSDKTRHNILATLHSMFVWLKRRQEIPAIPEFPVIKYELGYRRTVDKGVQAAILEDIRQHEPFKVWMGVRFLATYISVRPMEMMNITYQNVDPKNGYLYFPHPKEKKYKAVPILPADVALLGSLPAAVPSMFVFGEDGKRYGVNRFYKAWKRACGRLGIEGVDLYGGTRHSSARALRAYFSPEEIKRATMHSSNAAFERYFTMEADDVRSIYQRSADVVDIKGQSERARKKANKIAV